MPRPKLVPYLTANRAAARALDREELLRRILHNTTASGRVKNPFLHPDNVDAFAGSPTAPGIDRVDARQIIAMVLD